MNNFVDLNLTNISLEKKALLLGYSQVCTLTNVIEAPDVEALVRKCKGGSALVVNPLAARDFYKGAGLFGAAREKELVFEIPISAILRSRERSKLFFQLRIFLKNCTRRKAPFIFTSRAANEFELKSPREIIAIGQTLGLTYEQTVAAISAVPQGLLKK